MDATPRCNDNELDLASASREELIEKINKLQEQVAQQRGKRSASEKLENLGTKRLTKRQRQGKFDRPFDFSKHSKRHVALKIVYLGWDYQGFASQDGTNETIEYYLFDALTRSKLIESRSTSNYHRCGRTDKGVSAFSQVITIDLRCKTTNGIGIIAAENPVAVQGEINDDGELDYCKILNSILPKGIRVLAWSPVRRGLSARFDCVRREYKYFFPQVDLDLEKMRAAAKFLIGEHDFRNFCKLDTTGEKTTVRRIMAVELVRCQDSEQAEDSYALCQMRITGQAFVWHQIRCIVAVLILVGQGLEEPEVVRQLLDISSNPKKPQYSMAVDIPLILFDVDHGSEIDWKYSDENVYSLMGDFQSIWVQHAIKATMILDIMKTLQKDKNEFDHKSASSMTAQVVAQIPKEQLNSILMGSKPKIYRPLLQRPLCHKAPILRDSS